MEKTWSVVLHHFWDIPWNITMNSKFGIYHGFENQIWDYNYTMKSMKKHDENNCIDTRGDSLNRWISWDTSYFSLSGNDAKIDVYSYWKWPSRNSEFSQNGGSVHSYVNVYQRVNGNINPRIRVLGFYGDCQPPTAESMSWGRSPTADPQSSSWSREWLPPSVKHQKKCMLNDCTVWEFNVAMENHHFGIFWIRKSS